ncbi:C2H2-type domain-containing protein [Caenorhabditis elegans]|uniref:C2H2-type domain-containing protein n=1 Tax=Caenorhabditis elegans TaxID=6239 RepID=Q18933_CAEEL|nr:C2H2-type domain-containing protein [Caenorhabditis elegans]CAA92290.2 C2H2-type domain-containing protein [Caenorhabditis elegans]|eukprot:NP_501550.2 Uncharacterized protein CELE_D1046.2 [Caenorhabditis elegans]
MNDGYKQNDIVNHEAYEELEVAEEQIIYCQEEYNDGPGTMVQVQEQTDVPCYVMEGTYFTPENIYAANQDHSVCHFCKEDLTNKRFYNHLFDHHGFTKQQCEMMKQQKRLGRPNPKRKSLHSCENCGMEFITKTGLTSHLKKDNSPCARVDEMAVGGSSVSNIVCPSYGCDKNVPTYLDLAIHVDTEHRDLSRATDSFRIRRVTFQDKAGFMKWKKQMEKSTNSEFFLRTSQKVSFAIRTMLYKCLFSNSRGQSKGRRCEQCPAFIKCCMRNHGQYEVVACFGHLGHEHPTETEIARQMRIEKYREIDALQVRESRMHNQHHMNVRPKQIIVDQYGHPTHPNDEMMILMPVGEEVVEEDAFTSVVVDDADDEIVGPRAQQETPALTRQVYIPTSNHHASSSHY